jgi:dienelactone hydrolase
MSLVLAGGVAAGCSSAGATAGAASAVPTAVATATPLPSVITLPIDFAANATFTDLLPLFNYQSDRPFDVKKQDDDAVDAGVITRDITFASALGEPVDAFLVIPAGKGPFPAVLFEHGSGGNRYGFLVEAEELAKNSGFVSLVVTHPSSISSPGDGNETIHQIREMRRELDFLAAQPEVDPSRLGYVGHSLGAMYGITLASVDTRVKAYVFMAPVPTQVVNFYAPEIKSGELFFQFGKADSLYTQADADALAALPKASKKTVWYDADHGLDAAAYTERHAWLTEKLGAK